MNYGDPAVWDDIWENEGPERILALLKRGRDAHPDWHARYAHALALAGQLPEALDQVETALEVYEGQPGLDVALLRAVRLMLLLASERYDDVIADARDIYGSSPRRMEAACLTQYAVAYAHVFQGAPQIAMVHLGQALGLANALDLPHRRRSIQIVWTHALTATGKTPSRDVLQNIANSPHKATAQAGAARMVESYMYAGDYDLAAEYAEAHNLPNTAVMARAFLGQFPTTYDPAENNWCQDVAYGIHMASQLRYPDIPVLYADGTSLGAYAQILNAVRSLSAGALTNFAALLGNEPGQPDQRAYWYALRLFGVLDGAIDGSPAEAVLQATEALVAVPNPIYVVRTLEAISPRAATLLSHVPDERLRRIFSGLTTPILVDDFITNHSRISIPTATAERLIADSLNVKWVINTGYLSKYRTSLTKKGIDPLRVVTVGDIYGYAEAIHASSNAGMAEAWEGVMIRLRRASPALDRVLQAR